MPIQLVVNSWVGCIAIENDQITAAGGQCNQRQSGKQERLLSYDKPREQYHERHKKTDDRDMIEQHVPVGRELQKLNHFHSALRLYSFIGPGVAGPLLVHGATKNVTLAATGTFCTAEKRTIAASLIEIARLFCVAPGFTHLFLSAAQHGRIRAALGPGFRAAKKDRCCRKRQQ